MTLYLSQARLRRDAPLAALAPLLMPAAADARAGVSHRLIWSLFAGEPDAKRAFLWREEASGRFLVLSEQLPADHAHGLFDLDSKPFAPNLAAGVPAFAVPAARRTPPSPAPASAMMW